jgi:hypothetical protein
MRPFCVLPQPWIRTARSAVAAATAGMTGAAAPDGRGKPPSHVRRSMHVQRFEPEAAASWAGRRLRPPHSGPAVTCAGRVRTGMECGSRSYRWVRREPQLPTGGGATLFVRAERVVRGPRLFREPRFSFQPEAAASWGKRRLRPPHSRPAVTRAGCPHGSDVGAQRPPHSRRRRRKIVGPALKPGATTARLTAAREAGGRTLSRNLSPASRARRVARAGNPA